MEEKVRFKYYRPIFYIMINVIWVVILVLSAYFLLKNVIFPLAIEILLGVCVLWIVFEYCIGNKLKDLSGLFVFHSDNFDIKAFQIKENIYFTDIVEIRKEYYEKNIGAIISQYNAGKYIIQLKNNKKYKFCIANEEEKIYNKKRSIGTLGTSRILEAKRDFLCR